MKHVLSLVVFLTSAHAFALPGSKSVDCKSLKGAKQEVVLSVASFDAKADDFPQSARLSIHGFEMKMSSDDQYAAMTLALNNDVLSWLPMVSLKYFDGVWNKASATLTAIPSTMKIAPGSDDLNGSATFTGKLDGSVTSDDEGFSAHGQRVQCKISWDGGSAG